MSGSHRFTTRWQFVDDADVQVAIERHCQSARDWGGCHHQDVGRILTLAPQLGTLGHTEAVLFIDDNHSQTCKLYGVLDDGMSAYKDVDGAVE